MGRPATGSLVQTTTKQGVSFGARFSANGKRQFVTLGSSDDGWTRQRAEEELRNLMADVRRGIWQPPPPVVADERTSEPTFHEFATEWFEGIEPELRPSTAEAYRIHLTCHLLPFFRDHQLSAITVQEVDRYRHHKVKERDALRAAKERGKPIMETLLDRRGRELVRERRPLTNETVNKTLVRLGQVLDQALEYGLIESNPAKGRRRKLKADKPRRSYLDRAAQITALLDAAGEMDREVACHRHVARRPLLAVLVFAGLRLGEALALTWGDVDLAGGWLNVGRSKTDAGVRRVRIRPALRDELLALKANTPGARLDALVFGTVTGKSQSQSNVRRMLTKAATRANRELAETGELPLPAITPHSCRRTFASVLLACGESLPVVMSDGGWEKPDVPLRIYGQVMNRDPGENDRLRALVGERESAPEGASAIVDLAA